MMINLMKYSAVQLLLLVFVMAATVTGCNRKAASYKTVEDFDEFYDRFHQDPNFQMERIKFPLEGAYIDIEGETSWEPGEWELHKEKVTDVNEPNYDTEIIKREDVVIDKVKLRDSGFYTERRFQLIEGNWYLVYYESVNL